MKKVKAHHRNIKGKIVPVSSYTRKGSSPLTANLPTKALLTGEGIKASVEDAYPRLKSLGSWPDYIQSTTLTNRIPSPTEVGQGGFDAGIACALDLIPRDKQRLAAILHAAYTPEAIQQIRDEREHLEDTETMWWAGACFICDEGPVDWDRFQEQLQDFKELATKPNKMVAAAKDEIDMMTSAYELQNGIPFAKRDGGTIGAYIDGYEMGVAWSEGYGIYFISTYKPTLGLEDFEWDNEPGPTSNSGPVHGSKQYVKASNEIELNRVLKKIAIR